MRLNTSLFRSIVAALLLVLLGLPAAAFAQHCPFDGGAMIVVELVDSHNKPFTDASRYLTLREVDNPDPSRCKYADKLGIFKMLPPIDEFATRYERRGKSEFKERCKDCAFNKDGFYSVILGQATENCMIEMPGSNDYTYVKRKYEVSFDMNGFSKQMRIPEDRIYEMCTGYGSWSRMQAVKFVLPALKIKVS